MQEKQKKRVHVLKEVKKKKDQKNTGPSLVLQNLLPGQECHSWSSQGLLLQQDIQCNEEFPCKDPGGTEQHSAERAARDHESGEVEGGSGLTWTGNSRRAVPNTTSFDPHGNAREEEVEESFHEEMLAEFPSGIEII